MFKLISKNEKVVISGLGGDEIFGNYNRGKFFLDCLGEKKSSFLKEANFESYVKYRNYRYSMIKNVDLNNILENGIILNNRNTAEKMFDLYNEDKGIDLDDKLTKVAIETQMTDEFLMMVDRFSMAHSLEVRTPYLDNEFVDLVLSIPTKLKIHSSVYKIMLRRAVGKYLPKSVLGSKKRGFSIPLSHWMRGPLKPLVNDLLGPSALKKSEFVNPTIYDKYVKPMFDGDNNHISLIWSVLMFQLWTQNIYKKQI